MSDDSIKEKIRKVLALLEGAKTEGEAQAASLALQRLLYKSGLSIAEALDAAGSQETVEETRFDCGTSSSNWKLLLAATIAENYRCKLYTRKCGRNRTAVFVGTEADAKVAEECLKATIAAAQRCYRAYAARRRREDPLLDTGRTAFRNGYYRGFARGLAKAYAEQRESEELSLSLQVPAAVRERYYEIARGFSTPRKVKYRVTPSSYEDGVAEGYGYGRGDRLEEGAA